LVRLEATLQRRAGSPTSRLADFFDAVEMERSLEVAQPGVKRGKALASMTRTPVTSSNTTSQ
jgi:hypothetical protein